MEIKCIENVLKELDNLINDIIENENIQDISFDKFLDNCFSIIKKCKWVKQIYFSEKPVNQQGKFILELSLKNEIIGYVILEVNDHYELVNIFLQNLKQIIFMFLSFKELYSTLSELKYIGIKFTAYRKAFYDISRAILSSLSEDIMLRIICQISQELILCSACVIFFKNKVVYTASNKLIDQELNFIIPEIKNLIDKKLGILYNEIEVINIDNDYAKHLKTAFIKRFTVPIVGMGTFVLLFSKETELSTIDLDFVSTVTSSIATALETRRLFEQLAIKNSFLEKLFISSAKLSEINSFEEVYPMLYNIVNEIFTGCDFVIFRIVKGEVFKPVYIRISNSRLYNFVEASELSLIIISEELLKNFSVYKSIIVFKDEEQKSDLVKFFNLIFQKPYIVIPILEKNKLNSLIVFNIKYQFWVDYQGILDVLANHLSILFSYVFSRISAYEKLVTKSNENRIINKVIFDYSSVRDINILINNIVKEINSLVNYALPVFVYYKGGKILFFKTLEHYKSLILAIINNLPDLIIHKIKESVELLSKGSFKPILINNLELFFDNVNIYDFVKKSGLKSLLILPLRSEIMDQYPLLLVFSLGKRFEQEYIDLLYSLANHFSIFFENASIYSLLEKRLKATDILYNFLRIVTSVLDPYNVVMSAINFIEELVKPELFFFIMKKYNRFEFIYIKTNNKNEEYKVDKNLIIKILGSLKTNIVFINSTNLSANRSYKKLWSEVIKISSAVKQLIVIPIVYLNEILGYIILGLAKETLGETLNWILTNIPYALATPLKNSMIMQEQVEISNIIRQALITKIDKKTLSRKGIDVSFKHITSREITADWIELIDKEDYIVIILADVSGKGAKSAIYTAQAKFAAKSLFYTIDDFKYSVNQLNKILSSTVSDDTFITMFVVKIYRENEKVYCQYVSAGHEPMIVIKKSKKLDILSTKDIPLCINEGYEYKPHTYELEKGDIIFLYTDGVIDIKNERGENFGREKLIQLIKNLSYVTNEVKEFTDKVYIEVMKYSTSPLSHPPDDMTILFLKIL